MLELDAWPPKFLPENDRQAPEAWSLTENPLNAETVQFTACPHVRAALNHFSSQVQTKFLFLCFDPERKAHFFFLTDAQSMPNWFKEGLCVLILAAEPAESLLTIP